MLPSLKGYSKNILSDCSQVLDIITSLRMNFLFSQCFILFKDHLDNVYGVQLSSIYFS